MTCQVGPIGLDKSGYQVNIFLISPRKHIYVMGIHQKHLGESLLMSTHMFSWRNKKTINGYQVNIFLISPRKHM